MMELLLLLVCHQLRWHHYLLLTSQACNQDNLPQRSGLLLALVLDIIMLTFADDSLPLPV
jgi:hypothetical protein